MSTPPPLLPILLADLTTLELRAAREAAEGMEPRTVAFGLLNAWDPIYFRDYDKRAYRALFQALSQCALAALQRALPGTWGQGRSTAEEPKFWWAVELARSHGDVAALLADTRGLLESLAEEGAVSLIMAYEDDVAARVASWGSRSPRRAASPETQCFDRENSLAAHMEPTP